MKSAKKILACIMAAVMAFGVCSIIASAATLQSLIDATTEGDILVLSQDYCESVVIDKPITLDLNGHEIKGEAGKIAITVNAESTIKNGKVISEFADVTSMELIKRVKTEAVAAIKASADITLENLCAVGANARVPSSADKYLPVGSAVETIGTSVDAFLDNAVLVGRYGVNNAVTNNTAGGKVTIEDAVVFGFMGAVKDETKLVIDSESSKVDAAGFVSDILVDGAFTSEEIDFFETALKDTCFICAKDPVVETPVISGGWIAADVDVSNDLDVDKNFGFSYKWVPERAILEGGSSVDFVLTDGEYKAQVSDDKAEVEYRLWCEASSEVRDFIEGLGDLTAELEKDVKKATETFNSKYNDYVKLVSKAYYKFDEIGAKPVPGIGGTFSDFEDFYNIQKTMFALGGKKMYEVAYELTGDEGYKFGFGTYYYFYGNESDKLSEVKNAFEAEGGNDGNYGVLDYVDDLVEEFNSLGTENADNWADALVWFYTNYSELTALVDDAANKLADLETALNSEMIKLAIEVGNLEKYISYFDKIKDIVESAETIIDTASSDTVIGELFEAFENDNDKLAAYADKFVAAVEDPESYVDISVDDDYIALCTATEKVKSCQHVFDSSIEENVALTEATCEDEGSIVIKCANEKCDAEHKVTIPALGHSYEATVFAATCTAEGYTLYKCVRHGCADSFIKEKTEKLAHDFNLEDIKVITEPTHTEVGKGSVKCKNCDATKSVDIPALSDEHSFTETVVAPTCDTDGSITYTCECGINLITVLEKLGHCYDETVAENVTITPATCIAKGVMVIKCNHEGCSSTKEVVLMETNHDFDNARTETIEPTCEEDGKTTFFCNNCDGTLDGGKREVVLPALGHIFDIRNKIQIGEDAFHIDCSNNCGKYQTIGNYVGAVGCRCDINNRKLLHPQNEELCGGPCLLANREEHKEICERYVWNQHVYNEEVISEATCTQEKKIRKTCVYCERSIEESVGEPLGHTFDGKWTDCGDGKHHYRACMVTNCDGREYEEHKFENYVFKNNAKFLEDGTEEAYCSADGCDAKDERIAEDSSKACRIVKWMFGWSTFLTATFMNFIDWLRIVFKVAAK